MKKAIGIDIGGTKVAAGIVLESGELLGLSEVKSDPSDREKMFERVAEAVEQVLENSSLSIHDVEGMGVGVPGKVDRAEGIAVFQNNLPWRNFPVMDRLMERFGTGLVKIDNDVYMAAFAEWKASQGKLDETFVYMTISTGISCSIIHHGSFLRGAGFAGELGLIPVLSKVGNERLEKVASGPALQKRAQMEWKQETIMASDVFAGYVNGNPDCRMIIEELAGSLAQGVYSISALLDPDKMAFGGSVVVNNPFLLDLIKERLKVHQLPEQQHLLSNMTISTLGQKNGVIGAGLRVFEGLS